MNTDDILTERFSSGQSVSHRVTHKATGLVVSAPTRQAALAELRAKVSTETGTTTEIVSVCDTRTVGLKVTPACRMELDGGALHVTRAVATYCRVNGGPWEVGIVRLAGHDDDGTANDAVVLESPDWPEWLTMFVYENNPENLI